MLTTISFNPSSIIITGSLFLLTLIRSCFSSLDSTIPTPFHSCSFVPLRSNLQPPQLFRLYPFHLVTYTHNKTNLSGFHHIHQAHSFSRHRPNIQTAHSHTVTVQMPHKNDIYGDYIKYSQPQKENREENDFHLFTGSIMDPFKTGPTGLFATALVSLGKSGRFHLVWYESRPQFKNCKPPETGQFPLTQRVSSQWPRFNQLRDGQKLPKNRFWRICINTNCENENDWLDYWSGRKIN